MAGKKIISIMNTLNMKMKPAIPLILNNFSFKTSMANIISLIGFDCSRIAAHNENKPTKKYTAINIIFIIINR